MDVTNLLQSIIERISSEEESNQKTIKFFAKIG